MARRGGTVEPLVELGLTEYQARVYSSLVSLGVASASEVHRKSGVPRTKIYETLEELSRKGAVETQPGRPALYRAVHPQALVRRLVEDYTESAGAAATALEGEYQEGRAVQYDMVWTVKGERGVRRKLADLITSARADLLVLETYPPSFIRSVEKLLRAVAKRGIRVRVVSVLTEGQPIGQVEGEGLVEFRRITGKGKKGGDSLADREVLDTLAVTLGAPYGVAVADRQTALVMVRNPREQSGSIGLSAKIPGVPLLLRLMFERYIVSRTRAVRPEEWG